MTSKENKAIQSWCKDVESRMEQSRQDFEYLGQVYEESGGGKRTSSWSQMVEYLKTSNDPQLIAFAKMTARNIRYAEAQQDAMRAVIIALANAK